MGFLFYPRSEQLGTLIIHQKGCNLLSSRDGNITKVLMVDRSEELLSVGVNTDESGNALCKARSG